LYATWLSYESAGNMTPKRCYKTGRVCPCRKEDNSNRKFDSCSLFVEFTKEFIYLFIYLSIYWSVAL